MRNKDGAGRRQHGTVSKPHLHADAPTGVRLAEVPEAGLCGCWVLGAPASGVTAGPMPCTAAKRENPRYLRADGGQESVPKRPEPKCKS